MDPEGGAPGVSERIERATIFALVATMIGGAALAGCATPPAAVVATSPPRHAHPTIQVTELRVLHGPVNMMEPLAMEVAGDEVIVTFATGKQDGVTLAVDPATLATRVTDSVTYPERPKDAQPPYLAAESTHVPLVDGGWLTVWTDCQASRVYAQRFDVDGRAQGDTVLVSHADADVLGPARALTVDGKRVVVAFFATHLGGYELVAAALQTRD